PGAASRRTSQEGTAGARRVQQKWACVNRQARKFGDFRYIVVAEVAKLPMPTGPGQEGLLPRCGWQTVRRDQLAPLGHRRAVLLLRRHRAEPELLALRGQVAQ